MNDQHGRDGGMAHGGDSEGEKRSERTMKQIHCTILTVAMPRV
jgi:hypothetical protein